MIISNTKKTIIYSCGLLFCCLVFLYFIPKEIAYPKYKILNWFQFVLIFIVIPYLVFKILRLTNENTSPTKTFGICALSILMVGPSFGFFQKYREEQELKINGKETICVVINRKKTPRDWMINCKYYVTNSEFTTYYETDRENKYRIGDTLKLIYNKDFPLMYKIVF